MLLFRAVAAEVRAVGQAAVFALGATVGLVAIFGGANSGVSINPYRYYAPALVSWE